MGELWDGMRTTKVATAKTVDNAEVCSECGALVELWSRDRHREFHESLKLLATAQERLNRATRSFVKVR